MNLSPQKTAVGLLVTMFFLLPSLTTAKYHFDLTPAISMREVYDDNIYLSSANEKSDYMTTISPSVNLDIRSGKDNLMFRYAPAFVWYAKEDQNNTVRHSGTLNFNQGLTRSLSFDLSDKYLKSEEPIEETEDVEGIRNTRYTYQRNIANASLQYLFGPKNALNVGYRHSLLKNEDPTEDDSTIQNPFAKVTYWFNKRNGVELNYGSKRADFCNNRYIAGDDYRDHTAGIRYIRLFSPHTLGSIDYDFTTRHFEGTEEDYKVHEGNVDFEHTFSPEFYLSAGVGYFVQQNERTDNGKGYTYDVSLIKHFRRGRISCSGRGGWDEAYQEAERRGFSEYWGADIRLEYQITEYLSSYASVYYRSDKDDTSRKWKTSRGKCGITWAFLRWFSLSLAYSYAERDDDVDTEDYEDKQLMLIVTSSKLFRW